MRYILSAILVAGLIETTGAGPGPEVKYLMDEPVSLLDWGLFRLEQHFKNLPPKYQSMLVTADYVWNENRLMIAGTLRDDRLAQDQRQERCREAIDFLKTRLLVDPAEGQPIADHSVVGHFFSHRGFGRESEPDSLRPALDRITRFRVSVVQKKSASTCTCQSDLLSTEILFEERE